VDFAGYGYCARKRNPPQPPFRKGGDERHYTWRNWARSSLRSCFRRIDLADLPIERPVVVDDADEKQASGQEVEDGGEPLFEVEAVRPRNPKIHRM
jgi:hypothetical protein